MRACADAVAPVLVFGWGNPSRGDDAIGPLLIQTLTDRQDQRLVQGIDLMTDFQLQVEHALDLVGRERVLFVDASLDCATPFAVSVLQPWRDASFSTHAMSPQAVMQVYRDIRGDEPPPCLLLAIRGEQFELGAGLSDAARANLELGLRWCQSWLDEQRVGGVPSLGECPCA